MVTALESRGILPLKRKCNHTKWKAVDVVEKSFHRWHQTTNTKKS